MLRMNSQPLPLLIAEGHKFEQINYLRTFEPGGYGEWGVWIMSVEKNYTARVCAYRKTDEQRFESKKNTS